MAETKRAGAQLTIVYTLTLTVTRPVMLEYEDDTLETVAKSMEDRTAKARLERDVLHELRKLDGECDIEVMDTERKIE